MDKLDLSKSEAKETYVCQARGLARYFSVKVEIRLFGKLVWSFIWPPQNSDEND